MENFKLLKIEDSLKNSLQKMNFTKPTPIQAMAIPVALEGKDIFLHVSSLEDSKLRVLKEEQTIFYDIKEEKNKLQAINIKKK